MDLSDLFSVAFLLQPGSHTPHTPITHSPSLFSPSSPFSLPPSLFTLSPLVSGCVRILFYLQQSGPVLPPSSRRSYHRLSGLTQFLLLHTHNTHTQTRGAAVSWSQRSPAPAAAALLLSNKWPGTRDSSSGGMCRRVPTTGTRAGGRCVPVTNTLAHTPDTVKSKSCVDGGTVVQWYTGTVYQ